MRRLFFGKKSSQFYRFPQLDLKPVLEMFVTVHLFSIDVRPYSSCPIFYPSPSVATFPLFSFISSAPFCCSLRDKVEIKYKKICTMYVTRQMVAYRQIFETIVYFQLFFLYLLNLDFIIFLLFYFKLLFYTFFN